MRSNGRPRGLPRLRPVTAMLLLAWAGGGAAMELDTGVPELKLRWDNTVRYNLGTRAERPDQRILNNPTYDESDGKFGRGDVVTNRLDLLTEIDANYRNLTGVRISAAAWYDHAYHDTTVSTTVPGYASSYLGDRYNHAVSRFVQGPAGEWLDAFVWTNLKLGDVPVNVKLGRQTNYFGEGLLIPAHAMSYSQSPVDGVKAVTSPGIETKEVFLPVSQLYVKSQVTPALTLMAQYFLDWKASRLPYGGTYFAPADPFFEGPDRLPVAPNGASLARADSLKPGRRGNWGVGAKLNVEALESAFGLYHRRFDDYNPWFAPDFANFVTIPGVGTGPTGYRLVYPKQVKMTGISAGKVIGSVSVAGDLAYRKDGALNAAGISPLDHQGPRGDTLHAVVNGVYLLPATRFWDTGAFIAELAYSRLLKVTSHAELYKGAGTAACVAPDGKPGGRGDDCSTKNYTAIALSFSPQYLQVAPSWDLDVPLSVNYGIDGNAASSGGGSGKSLAWSIGAKLTYAQRYEFALQYADSAARTKYDPSGLTVIGGAGSVGATDRGWLVFTFKAGF
ncbi:MAG: DUF1302 domain-containing protein [Burkholderiaceae bacterium]|nr:DUF1302 domain-containing protein [Burkholderiaceae bacterium]